MFVKNIGKEKIFIKFKYNNAKYKITHEWFDCREPPNGLDFYESTQVQLETSIYDPFQYGCTMTINYDKSVNDIIFHDVSNTTWNSISRVYGTFDQSLLLAV